MKTLVEVDTTFGHLRVFENNGIYQVELDGIVRHSHCSADDVIRVLSHYLASSAYAHSKLLNYINKNA